MLHELRFHEFQETQSFSCPGSNLPDVLDPAPHPVLLKTLYPVCTPAGHLPGPVTRHTLDIPCGGGTIPPALTCPLLLT